MIDFQKCFQLLTGNLPFAWQTKLYQLFLNNQIPSACDIPTGLGKTSVITIWLLALATKLLENAAENRIPRRLVYVVDRRVIVDQATKDAEDVLTKINALKTDENIGQIYEALKNASFLEKDENVIALSTLRGEFADNREWMLDPSRPAIIVGTIDMIGSRLLFSGYGKIGKSYKSLQAGLLGQDALVVVDEAHLSPSFMTLLDSLKLKIEQTEAVKPFLLMRLSATLTNGQKKSHAVVPETTSVFRVDETDEDAQNPQSIVYRRLFADKQMVLSEFNVSADDLKNKATASKNFRAAQAEAIVEQAFEYARESAAIVIYVKEVETVKQVKNQLVEKLKAADFSDAETRVLAMTGGMRGKERDEITKNDGNEKNLAFQKFVPSADREKPDGVWYLVATSTAEVGVNLDADHAVCDLTSLDSLTQRSGRVNRFGNGAASIAVVVSPQQVEISQNYFVIFDELKVANQNLDKSSKRIEFSNKEVEDAKEKVETAKRIVGEAKQESDQKKVSKKSIDEIAKSDAEKAKQQLDQAKENLNQTKFELNEAKQKLSELKNAETSAKKYQKEVEERFDEISKTYVKPLALDEAEIFTFQKLEENENNGKIAVSPSALKKMSGDGRCYPLAPVCPPLDAARIDDWAMTSVAGKDFARSQVAPWLRGVVDDETTETNVCWRADLKFAVTAENPKEPNADALKMISVVSPTSRETARETTVRARALLLLLANELESKNKDEKFYVIGSNGEAKSYEFKNFVTAAKRSGEKISDPEKKRTEAQLFEMLFFSTVILPSEVGGLKDGLVIDDAKQLFAEENLKNKSEKKDRSIKPVEDVAGEKNWLRVVFEPAENGWTARNLVSDEIFGENKPVDELIDEVEKLMRERKTPKKLVHKSQAHERNENDDAEELEEIERKAKEKFVGYFVALKSPEHLLRDNDDDIGSINYGKRGEVTLKTHNLDVENYARRIAEKVNLSAELTGVLTIAGKWHDVGKNRTGWQKAIGNKSYPEKILAKSGHNRFNRNYSQGYRHEFGSLIEAEADKDLKTHPHRDLILHLIAAHHGWARPHFPERAFDPKEPNPFSRQTANRAMRRFASLQNEFGWWQLAYLEAILKAADALASRDRIGED